jgi:hypothetical protein
MKCFLKMLATAAAGWAAFNAAMFLTFRLIGFGMDGHGVLLNPETQSAKLIAVWTKLEPLPLVVAKPHVIIAGLFAFAFMQAVTYRLLSPAWPVGIRQRALRLAALRFTLTFLFWEFFTPFNQLGEPLPLIAVELSFWAVVALAESFAIAATAETLWKSAASTKRA